MKDGQMKGEVIAKVSDPRLEQLNSAKAIVRDGEISSMPDKEITDFMGAGAFMKDTWR